MQFESLLLYSLARLPFWPASVAEVPRSGHQFDSGLISFPLSPCASAPVLLSSTADGINGNNLSLSPLLSCPATSPQAQPLASFSPHFTHSAKFPQLLRCSSSTVPLPVWCLKVGVCVLQWPRQSCGIFRQQLRSPTRCGLETNQSLPVVPEQSGSCARPVSGQAGHWQPCLPSAHFTATAHRALSMPAKLPNQMG